MAVDFGANHWIDVEQLANPLPLKNYRRFYLYLLHDLSFEEFRVYVQIIIKVF